jgi:hypothetical protein
MCAVDALGIGAMIDRDIAISSRCRQCGAPIRIATRDRGRALAHIEPTKVVMWQSVRYDGACAANSLCTTTAFFCSDDHLSAWRREYPAEPGFRLSIEEGLQAGRALFGPSLAGLDTAERSRSDGGTEITARMPEGAPSKISALAERHVRKNSRNGGPYDLVVIGAGSAGFSAAITAAELGARVALIGHGTIGGTCVNTGCVPSKNLIRATEALYHAGAAARFRGLWAEGYVEDWQAVTAQKDELVQALRRAKYIDLLPSYDTVAYVEGQARLTEGGVAVDGNLIRADKIIIATGASPAVPPIPGIETVPYLTSTTALDLAVLPRSLLVIGGGYVGCELGQMFARAGGVTARSCNVRGDCGRSQRSARAGVAVTIVDVLPILSAGEPEIATALKSYFCDEGIIVHDGVATRALRKTGSGIALDIATEGREERIEA